MDAACREAGRDPATLERTLGVLVDGSDTGPRQSGGAGEAAAHVRARIGTATGSAEDLAALFQAFAAEGITHVQVWPEPNTLAGLEAFAPVLRFLDGG